MKSNLFALAAGFSILAAGAASAQFTGIDDATPRAVSLNGSTKYDGWYNFSSQTKSKTIDGVARVISGVTGYPTALQSSPAWNSPIASQLQSDATKKAAFTKITNGDGSGYDVGYETNGLPKSLAFFNANGTPKAGATWKKANGTAGSSGYGPIPSGDSLYAISFSNDINTRQGTTGIFEANPVAGLKNVAIQIEVGGANGYDFYNHSTVGMSLGSLNVTSAFPVLSLTLTDNSVITLAANYAELLTLGYNGTIPMPTGPNGEPVDEPIYISLYGFQWDTSAYTNIQSFNITWTLVEHTQFYAARLDQGSQFNQVFGATAVPEPSTWALLIVGTAAGLYFRRRRVQGARKA